MKLLALPIIVWNRLSHLVRERKRISAIEGAIKSIRREYDRAKKNRMPHFQRVYNVGLYILVFEYDFSILKNDALFAVRPWKKNFVARQFAVLLYEASHDLPELLGKEFRESLRTLPLTDSDWANLNAILKRINEFKKEHHSQLNTLRNYVGAHRDKDAGKQLEIIDNVNLLDMADLAVQFYAAMSGLVPLLTKITLSLGDLKVIFKHMTPEMMKSATD